MKCSVLMITYNHELFIKEAILGVLAQTTNFDIELIVADDCSSDKTEIVVQEILNTHPKSNIIRYTRHSANKGMMPNFIWALDQCRGKYIALCEGDDYWTDSNKLQKQVDFMESNPEYSICWGGYTELHMSKREFIKPNWKNKINGDFIINLDNIFSPYSTMTLTVLFRSSCFYTFKSKDFKYLKDNTIYIQCLSQGKGYLFNCDFGIYRIHQSGIYSMQTDYYKSLSSYLNITEALNKINGSRTINLFSTRKYLLRSTLETMPYNQIKDNLVILIDGIIIFGLVDFFRIILSRINSLAKSKLICK